MREKKNTDADMGKRKVSADHIPVPGSSEAAQMTAASGQKCREMMKRNSPLGCLGSILLDSSAWGSKRRILIWKKQATKSGRSYYQLLPSMRGRKGREHSLPVLYPTPTASIGKMGFSNMTIGLTKSNGLQKISPNGECWNPNLEAAVFCRPPVAQEYGIVFQEPETEELKKKWVGIAKISLGEDRINPSWVEWLMGFPHGWTEAEYSEKQKAKQKKKSGSLAQKNKAGR